MAAQKGSGKRREPTLKEEIAASGETPVDAAREAERADHEELRFLGREFLTWLVYHADAEGGGFAASGEVAAFAIGFGGRVMLRTATGMVTEVTLGGASPGASPDLRYAIAGGLSVKEADLLLVQDDREYRFALAAEHFDLKRVKLPALLTDEEDDPVDERLSLLAALDAALRLAYARFLALRTRPGWTRTVVPAIRAWLDAGT
ncbi:MAG: hypothetical protein EXR72_27280 [Myxococcales bacterium]|nr:hypothetical protein [Myxococcales bacterium]